MTDKHFEIHVLLGNTCFKFLCTTLNEAYSAICDILCNIIKPDLDIGIELDRAMEALVDIKSRQRGCYNSSIYEYSVFIRDGEV